MKSCQWKWTLVLLMTLALSACSSSQTKEADGEEVIAPAADAGTDAVPGTGTDVAAAPAADGALPTDAPPVIDAAPPTGAAADAPASLSATPPADLSAPVASSPGASASPTDSSAPPMASAPSESPANAAGTMASSASSQSDGPTSSSASSGSSDGPAEEYKVQTGDTLMKIAFETYGDIYQWKKIYESNKDKISNPNAIKKGTVLKIERPSDPVAIERNGEKYLIKEGDTLGKISDAIYGTKAKWKKLWNANKHLIHDPNRIFAGFYLYYTAGPGEVQSKAEEAPASEPSTPVSTAPDQNAMNSVSAAPSQASLTPPAPAAANPLGALPSAGAAPLQAAGAADAPIAADNSAPPSAPTM